MSYVLYDKLNNSCLAVVSDGAVGEWLQAYYLTNGVLAGIRAHDSVICETIDDPSEPIYIFDV